MAAFGAPTKTVIDRKQVLIILFLNQKELVATMMLFRTGLLVRNDSDIRKIEDLRGKRMASGFKGAPLFQTYFGAFLKNAGMTWSDVKKVPAIGLAQHWNLFKQGKVDVAMAGVGGGKFYTDYHPERLVDDLKRLQKVVTTVVEQDIWDMPVVLFLLFGLFALEWLIRRRKGMS